MTAWTALLDRPRDLAVEGAAERWFSRIATHLLGPCRLVVNGSVNRLVEVEFYFDSTDHHDPFVHCHPEQATRGRWYFHRAGASYRGGSFKGVDLTFGEIVSDEDVAHGGILIRSLETPDGRLVVGPSLCVDTVVAQAGLASVAALDHAIGGRLATDTAGPMSLVDGAEVSAPVFRSARVGLTLKRFTDAVAVDRIARAYRFLSEPRRITKGRAELIASLLAEGRSPEDIRQLTGSPLKTIVARRG